MVVDSISAPGSVAASAVDMKNGRLAVTAADETVAPFAETTTVIDVV